MTRLIYDASVPPANPPATDVVMIYAVGDTPHVWTEEEIAAQTARWRLPTAVASNPAAWDCQGIANAMVAWLRAHKVPEYVATVLDLETAIAPGWVACYASVLHGAGYYVLPYGSRSTIGANPRVDGYFTAHPGATAIDPGAVATQFAYEGAYDLSWIEDTVPLWRPGVPIRLDFRVSGNVADVLEWPHGGVIILGTDGAIYAVNGAPYLGGAFGEPYFVTRTAAELLYYPAGPRPGTEAMREGYTIVDTTGERYNYPTS